MTSPLPKISIVTPSLNKGRFIRATVESVLSQGYSDLEYGIVDGGSSDGTIDTIRSYEDRIDWWISEPDDGLYDALNKGFQRTTGEIMAYLNADDMYTPWALSVVGDIFALFPKIEWLTTLHPLAWDVEGRAVRCSTRVGYSAREFGRGGFLARASRPGTHWIQQESTFWRRSLWERAGGCFDTTLSGAGDFELWGRFFQHAKLHGVDTPLGGFRRYGDQKSLQLPFAYVEEAERVLVRMGGRPRGRLASLGVLALGRVCPAWHRARLDPVIVYDWDTCSWRRTSG